MHSTNPNPKPFKPKQDRYEKFSKSSMLLRESSFMSSSVQTTVTLDQDMIPKYQQQQNQCRICLDQLDQYGSKQLYSACKCTGSVAHLHEHCFTSWVNRSIQQKSPQQKKNILDNGSQCQLCKQLIPITSQFIIKCAPLHLIKHRIIKKPFIFSVFTIIQALSIAMISFVLSKMVTLQIGFDEYRIINSLIMICSLIVLVCLSVGVGHAYVVDYFVYQRLVVVGFGQCVKDRHYSNKISNSNISNNKHNNNKIFNNNNRYNKITNLTNQSYPKINPITQNINVSINAQIQQNNNLESSIQLPRTQLFIQQINQQSQQNMFRVVGSMEELQS